MAKSKKHTRKIVVDGATYRWKVSTRCLEPYPSPSHFFIPVIVFIESGNGQTLFFSVQESSNYKVNPKLVAEIIKQSLVLGWQPTGKTGEFHYQLPKELPVHTFYQAIIHSVTKKEKGYTLKIKLLAENVKHDGFHWVIVNFFDIENISQIQSFFDDLIETKSDMPTINRIEFDNNFQSYVQNYHVLFEVDGLQPITFHCKRLDCRDYSDRTLKFTKNN